MDEAESAARSFRQALTEQHRLTAQRLVRTLTDRPTAPDGVQQIIADMTAALKATRPLMRDTSRARAQWQYEVSRAPISAFAGAHVWLAMREVLGDSSLGEVPAAVLQTPRLVDAVRAARSDEPAMRLAKTIAAANRYVFVPALARATIRHDGPAMNEFMQAYGEAGQSRRYFDRRVWNTVFAQYSIHDTTPLPVSVPYYDRVWADTLRAAQRVDSNPLAPKGTSTGSIHGVGLSVLRLMRWTVMHSEAESLPFFDLLNTRYFDSLADMSTITARAWTGLMRERGPKVERSEEIRRQALANTAGNLCGGAVAFPLEGEDVAINRRHLRALLTTIQHFQPELLRATISVADLDEALRVVFAVGVSSDFGRSPIVDDPRWSDPAVRYTLDDYPRRVHNISRPTAYLAGFASTATLAPPVTLGHVRYWTNLYLEAVADFEIHAPVELMFEYKASMIDQVDLMQGQLHGALDALARQCVVNDPSVFEACGFSQRVRQRLTPFAMQSPEPGERFWLVRLGVATARALEAGHSGPSLGRTLANDREVMRIAHEIDTGVTRSSAPPVTAQQMVPRLAGGNGGEAHGLVAALS